MTTPVSSMILVSIASFIGSFGAVFLKSGSQKLKRGLRHVINIRVALGVSMYLFSTVFFIMGIRHGELTVLYPLVSLSYVWTLIWSRLFFREPITGFKFLGVGFILAGVIFIGMGNR